MEVFTLRTCFVVQGFGEKTDLSTGRVLNLDASYEVVKEAVEEAGLRCTRADEIIHSGTIDKPMYEWIYSADLVIADLSTYNVNAAYELGVRHGVRPGLTMILAENQFKNPFDVSRIVTLPYEHLGKDIGRREAARLKQVLIERITKLLSGAAVDSPVYTFLPLQPHPNRANTDAHKTGSWPQRQYSRRRRRVPGNCSRMPVPQWQQKVSWRPRRRSRQSGSCCREMCTSCSNSP